MPALKPTAYTARVSFLGRVTTPEGLLHAAAAETLDLTFAGVAGDVHLGRNRASCSRVTDLYPEGTEIANVRQLSVLSAEDLATIAAQMGLAVLDPGLLGATLVLSGLPDLSHLPPSSRLQGPSGVTLVVDMENRPCTIPARAIEAAHPGFGKAFKPAAQGRRGLTAWVEREGRLALGDTMKLFIPDQPVWSELPAARLG